MQVGTRTFSPKDLIRALAEDSFAAPLSLIGWMKVETEEAETFQFSPSQSCSDWISISADLIDTIEYLGSASCEEHRHPVVRLHFSVPADAQGRSYVALLGSLARLSTPPLRPSHLSTNHARGFGPACHACMASCQSIQDYYGMVSCSEDCMFGPCRDPLV
jgi:hypothetical protein